MARGFAVVATTALVVAAAAGVAVAIATQPVPHRAHHATALAAPDSILTPAPSPTEPRLFFATPQAAMRYLTAAYNRHDVVALKHVTDPRARQALFDMWREAINLRLTGCTRNPAGDYTCSFVHDYLRWMHKRGRGEATFVVGPAREHGWYMTVFEGCG